MYLYLKSDIFIQNGHRFHVFTQDSLFLSGVRLKCNYILYLYQASTNRDTVIKIISNIVINNFYILVHIYNDNR